MKRVYVIGMLPEIPKPEMKVLIEGCDFCVVNVADPGKPLPIGFRFGAGSAMGEFEVAAHEQSGRIALCRQVDEN